MPQAPGFWFASRPGVLALLLGPLSVVYGTVAALHRKMRGLNPYYAGVPVVSIGNITVGGSGKTPLVEALARYFGRQGHAVAVVAGGYGGTETRWPVQVNPYLHTARQVGDEPFMLAQALRDEAVAVWVCKNRKAAVRRAEEAGATLVIMDDGFHRADIGRNADIVVVDGPRGFGNRLLLPSGPLREPVAALGRASFAVVMDEPEARANQWYGISAYRLRLVPHPGQLGALQGKVLVAFAGIGNPQKFFDMLAAHGLSLAATQAYPDHYHYRADDLKNLQDLAWKHNAVLVTTAKDAARLPAGFSSVVEVAPTGADWQALLADLLPRIES